MRMFLIFLSSLFLSSSLLGQDFENFWRNWIFPYPESSFGAGDGFLIQFQKDGSLRFDSVPCLRGSGGRPIACQSDAAGNMKFYSNGCKIFGADHQLLENGDSLSPHEDPFVTQVYCISDNTRQGLVTFPAPADTTAYYLFHQRFLDNSPRGSNELLYSKINFPANKPRGVVTEKNKFLYKAPIGSIVAVTHANGRDWWVVTTEVWGEIRAYLVTPDGVSTEPVISSFGEFGFILTSSFSPDGKWFVQMGPTQVRVMCFDRCTGRFSCEQRIREFSAVGNFGNSFSPSSRFLYLSNDITLFQVDLASKELSLSAVGRWDLYLDGTVEHQRLLWHMPAPNGKTYINNNASVPYFHVIEHPDSLGKKCGFTNRGLVLPQSHQIQRFVGATYLTALQNSVCDTLSVTQPGSYIGADAAPPSAGFKILPSLATDEILIVFSGCTYGELRIYDMLGRCIHELPYQGRAEQLRIDVSTWPSGMYTVVVSVYKKDTEVVRFIKI
jgi:hypothetical protein